MNQVFFPPAMTTDFPGKSPNPDVLNLAMFNSHWDIRKIGHLLVLATCCCKYF